jgi:hypothetical protein
MQTTLDLDDDILYAAKQLAQQQRKSIGQVVSQLVRDAFSAKLAVAANSVPVAVSEPLHQNGIFPRPNRGAIASNESRRRKLWRKVNSTLKFLSNTP